MAQTQEDKSTPTFSTRESSRRDYCALVGKEGRVFQRPEIVLRLKPDLDVSLHRVSSPSRRHDSYFIVDKRTKSAEGVQTVWGWSNPQAAELSTGEQGGG
jgi:hypothetical protein